jgi:hypothetical protein
MIIRDVVEEEKMVNSVANFEHRCIEFICEYHGHLIAEITRVVDNDQPPT